VGSSAPSVAPVFAFRRTTISFWRGGTFPVLCYFLATKGVRYGALFCIEITGLWFFGSIQHWASLRPGQLLAFQAETLEAKRVRERAFQSL
jgi:hypothetical protein